MSEDALLDLSDKFEDIDDEVADDIASYLNMAIENKQDGKKGLATKALKAFNKACKDTLAGKPVKSVFEGKLNEISVPAKFGDEVFKVSPSKMNRDHVLKAAKKYKVDPKLAIQYVNQVGRLKLKEGKLNEDKAMKAIIKAPKGTEIHGGGYSHFTKLGHNSWKNYKTKTLAHDKDVWSRFTGFRDFELKKGKVRYFGIGGHQFEGKLTENFNKKIIKAKTMKDIKKVYPKAKKTSDVHGAVFYIELEKDLYAKAFSKNTMKSIEPFKIEAIYKMKGKKQTFLWTESKLNEDVFKSFLGDDPAFKLYTATNTDKRKSVMARKTDKTWDDGVPVLKYIARASKKDSPLPKGKFKIIEDNKHGWWYYLNGSTWYGIQQKDYGTPPFEY